LLSLVEQSIGGSSFSNLVGPPQAEVDEPMSDDFAQR